VSTVLEAESVETPSVAADLLDIRDKVCSGERLSRADGLRLIEHRDVLSTDTSTTRISARSPARSVPFIAAKARTARADRI
jgi:hypothetical protein